MKKLLAIVLVASFAFVGAFNASAVTIEELQAQIATLLQQIAALSGTTTTTTAATTTCFSTDLSQGMTSNDVKLLQEKLGVINTGYFGPLTLAAVKTYQGANGIPTTGYVGPLTRGSLNAKYCVTTPVTTTPTSTTPTTVVSGTEGTLTAEASPTFKESTLKYSDAGKVVQAAKLGAKNSDINVQRIDLSLIWDSTNAILPWKTYSSFDLYADGSLVKSISSIKDNFIENTFGQDYTLRFDNLSILIAKGGYKDVVVKATVLSNPENTKTTAFKFGTSSIRGIDGKGIDQYAGNATTFNNSVAIAASSKGNLSVSLNANSPKLSYIIGNASATTSDVVLGSFDIKAENRDVTIKTIYTTMTDAGTIASGIKLYDGSTLVGSAAGANGEITFSSLSILVAKDTTKTLTLKADIKPIDGSTVLEGKSILATQTASAAKIVAVDSNDDVATVTTGSVATKALTAFTKAPTIALVSTNITKTVQAGAKDIADTTIKFSVKANGGDIYIQKYAAGDIWVTTTGATSYQFDSTAEATTPVAGHDQFYLVRSGETKEFTITGRIEGADAFAKMSLATIFWYAATPDDSHKDVGDAIIKDQEISTTNYDLSTFETTSVYLNDPTN